MTELKSGNKKIKTLKLAPIATILTTDQQDMIGNGNLCLDIEDNDINSNITDELVEKLPDNVEPMEKHHTFLHTNEIQVENNLMKLVSDMNVPNDAFKNIMNWAKDAFCTGYQFNSRTTNYKSQIALMGNYCNLKYCRPYNREVTLPNDLNDPTDTTTMNVVCCDFTSMLFALFQDKTLNKLDNLVVNTNDMFSKYVSSDGKLGEVNSSSWYKQAYNNMVTDPNKDFLMPIIFAMDKTTISSTACMSVYAVMFSTTVFDYKMHNKAQAWRPLGYIPIKKNFHSSAQWGKMDKVLKSRRENIFFKAVLQSFLEAQQPIALLDVPITLGNKTKIVNLKVPLAFIIGDIQGGDNICGRSAYYKDDAKRICHMCDATPAAYISKEMNQCNLLVMEDIKQMCIQQKLTD